MQGGWLDFRAFVVNITANPGSSTSSSSFKVPADGTPSSNSVSASSSSKNPSSDVTPISTLSAPSPNLLSSPITGNVALGNGMAAVLLAAGAFLRLLSHGDGASRRRLRNSQEKFQKSKNLKVINCLSDGMICSEPRIFSISTSSGLSSLFMSRISSVLKVGWNKLKSHEALPTVLAAVLPPSSLALTQHGQDALRGDIGDGAFFVSKGYNSLGMVKEPSTGLEFPTQLLYDSVDGQARDGRPSCQILAGVGARSKEIMKFKSIKIYAFGLYVQPDHLRGQLGEEYKGFTAEELKNRPDILSGLLRRHEVEMTLRLVVHYKGLKMEMVRNAFQDSLKIRLNKIEDGANDKGLQTFCSYLSDDIRLYQGSTIDIRWQPGGRLRTEIEGRRVGVIHSHPLCQAFLDLYIGDPPVSAAARQEFGGKFGPHCRGKCIAGAGAMILVRFLSYSIQSDYT